MGLFLQNELKRGIYEKSAKIKNWFSNNLSKLRRLGNSRVLATNDAPRGPVSESLGN